MSLYRAPLDLFVDDDWSIQEMVTSEKISKPREHQGKIESKFRGTGNERYERVLNMIRTPTSGEYSRIVILAGIGISVLGALGFTIMLLAELLVPSA